MRKFKVEVYDANDLENVYECDVEELGQAMIQVMTQGHELYEVLKTKDKYLWHIINYSDDVATGTFAHAYGCFTTIGTAEITDITTYK